jgi:hypothetical protein
MKEINEGWIAGSKRQDMKKLQPLAKGMRVRSFSNVDSFIRVLPWILEKSLMQKVQRRLQLLVISAATNSYAGGERCFFTFMKV